MRGKKLPGRASEKCYPCPSFILTPGHLSMYDAKMRQVVEPGELEVMVGKSSSDIVLSITLLME